MDFANRQDNARRRLISRALVEVHSRDNGAKRFSAVIDKKPPNQEPAAAKRTYAQFDV